MNSLSYTTCNLKDDLIFTMQIGIAFFAATTKKPGFTYGLALISEKIF
jgi:hypothetical protein